jgi:hypothetical protein
MEKVASYLKSIKGQLLNSKYSYQTFGSWWFTFQKRGQNFRVVYDGKEFELRFENSPRPTGVDAVSITKWTEILVLPATDTNVGDLESTIKKIIQQGLKAVDVI